MQSYYSKDSLSSLNVEVGVDEAGRGPLFGPVYAAAVVWDDAYDEFEWSNQICDSKKLSKTKRQSLYEKLTTHLKVYGVGSATSQEVDQLNILNATRLAMQRAVNKLAEKLKDMKGNIVRLIIDGVRWESYFQDYKVISIKQGDSKYKSIASASILAKVEHDMKIKEIVKNHPDLQTKYGLLQNKGYGTKIHLEGLQRYGTSTFHRKTFKKCS